MEQNRKPRDLKELTSAALKVYAQEEKEAPVLAEVRTLDAEVYRLEMIRRHREQELAQLPTNVEAWDDVLDGLSYIMTKKEALERYRDKILLEHYRKKTEEAPKE